MVWGVICGPIQSELIIMPVGKQKVVDFIDNVYHVGLLPFINKLVKAGIAANCEGLMLMEGGACIHTALSSKKWHQTHQIHKFAWPPSSPDLNLIENLWFKMNFVVTNLFNSKTMDELRNEIHIVCNAMPFEYLEALAVSMPASRQMVVDKNRATTQW
ncbi:hypothetical protein O181_026116 [Austropuccinia psidii MF-1]|uniref:Tc1-like transposase DDE domain-containing protein n=1 Tax=Austropuccinia psidii MF-1 TaxID=1389203 RepID=A0A9Q3H072_9BASI|nr:hypothetical protein [Austropuccinia psidii MF-1]